MKIYSEKPIVSIVVPIYNIPESYLRNCIESILSQNVKAFELILINDGSPDNSGIICDEYAHNDNRIKVIYTNNSGVAAARNLGIEISNAEWITFIDPDDWVEPNYIEVFLSMLERKKVDVYICSCYVNYAKSQIKNPFFKENKIYATGKDKDRIMLQFLCSNIYGDNLCTADSGSPWCKLYRLNFLKKMGLKFDERLARMEDNKFNLFVYEKAEGIYFENHYLYHYRKSIYSGFSRFTPKVDNYYELFLLSLKEFIKETHKDNLFSSAYNVKVMNSFYVYCKMNYFHHDNPLPWKNKSNDIKLKLNHPLYASAIKNLDFNYLSLKEKLFALALKMKSPVFLYLLFSGKNILFYIRGKSLS